MEGTTEESREWRETIDEWWSDKLMIQHFTPRWAMQNIGTELFRQHFNTDIWIFALEKKLKNIEEQLNDEIDLQLNKNPNWKPKDDKSDKYAELVKNQSKLKDERDNKILELEGRSEKQKELLESYKKRFESSDKEISINPLQQSRQSKEKGKQLKEKIQKSLKENREEEVVPTLPAVQQNKLLAEVEESRRSALPEQRQQKKEEGKGIYK
jgi:hypothetical protein